MWWWDQENYDASSFWVSDQRYMWHVSFKKGYSIFGWATSKQCGWMEGNTSHHNWLQNYFHLNKATHLCNLSPIHQPTNICFLTFGLFTVFWCIIQIATHALLQGNHFSLEFAPKHWVILENKIIALHPLIYLCISVIASHKPLWLSTKTAAKPAATMHHNSPVYNF